MVKTWNGNRLNRVTVEHDGREFHYGAVTGSGKTHVMAKDVLKPGKPFLIKARYEVDRPVRTTEIMVADELLYKLSADGKLVFFYAEDRSWQASVSQ